MKFNTSTNIKSIVLFSMIICLFSCRKMDSTYSEYIKGGEILYVSKADSLKAYSGKNRILLAWPIGPDPKVSKALISWNNTEKSMEYIVDRSAGDTAKVWINDMPEGSYSFDVITYDNKGNSSVKVNVQGNVYSENYSKSIVNRRVKSAVYTDLSAIINWYDGIKNAVAVEVIYKDNQGQTRTVMTPIADEETNLPDYKAGTEIAYRTLYLPEPTSIDKFYTTASVVVPELQVEEIVKSKFIRWNPVSFPYTEYNRGSVYNIEKLWDNTYTGYGYIYLESEALPRSFTFDMGQSAKLKIVKLSPNWDSQLYTNGNVKKFQLWGSSSPNVTTDFATWVFLGEFNSFKPSGLPVGQTNAADLEYARAGEVFNLLPDTPPVRYIRFVVQDTWTGSISMHITELTFWGNISK